MNTGKALNIIMTTLAALAAIAVFVVIYAAITKGQGNANSVYRNPARQDHGAQEDPTGGRAATRPVGAARQAVRNDQRGNGHLVSYTVTAYCPCRKCCGKWADGITASGKPVTANGGFFVAADRSIPFGTMVAIPGYAAGKPVPVLDRGGAIKDGKLDVFLPDSPQLGLTGHQRAIQWGRQTLIVEIIDGN